MSWLEELRQSILHADAIEFLWGVGVGAILAGVGFVGAFRSLRRARIIEDTPTARIRSASQGYVELAGRGRNLGGHPLTAPLTGQACTWYRYKVQKKVGGGRNSRWKTIEKATSKTPIELVDETGRCIIDPRGAEVTPRTKQVWMGRSERPTRPPSDRRNRRIAFGMGRFMYTEERMYPDDTLYAIGLFRTLVGVELLPQTEAEIRALLGGWKQDPEMVKRVFDRDRDGQVNVQEWERARQIARSQVLRQQRAQFGAAYVHTLSKSKESRQPYLLSAVVQNGLVRRYRRWAVASAGGFLLCGAGVAWALGVRLAGGV